MLSMTTDVLFHKTTINYNTSRFFFVCVFSYGNWVVYGWLPVLQHGLYKWKPPVATSKVGCACQRFRGTNILFQLERWQKRNLFPKELWSILIVLKGRLCPFMKPHLDKSACVPHCVGFRALPSNNATLRWSHYWLEDFLLQKMLGKIWRHWW